MVLVTAMRQHARTIDAGEFIEQLQANDPPDTSLIMRLHYVHQVRVYHYVTLDELDNTLQWRDIGVIR